MTRQRSHRYAAAAAALLAAAVVQAAAAHDGAMAPVRVDARTMVLQPADLPTGFGHAQGGYVSNAKLQQQSEVVKDYAKLGRLTGYDVSYARPAASGVLGLDSFASLYRSSAGAHSSFLQSVAGARRQGGAAFRSLPVPTPLGSETRLYLVTTMQSGLKVDYYTVAWRHGRVFAEVMGGGVSGTFEPAELVALAAKQEARISSALP
jgi:ABC-type amino acid transport substrate-binding protein